MIRIAILIIMVVTVYPVGQVSQSLSYLRSNCNDGELFDVVLTENVLFYFLFLIIGKLHAHL